MGRLSLLVMSATLVVVLWFLYELLYRMFKAFFAWLRIKI